MLFAVGIGGEVSEPLEVNCLTCDTVDQVKEKILSTFRAKFGFPYNMPLKDIHIGEWWCWSAVFPLWFHLSVSEFPTFAELQQILHTRKNLTGQH